MSILKRYFLSYCFIKPRTPKMNPRVPSAMHQNTTNVTRIKKVPKWIKVVVSKFSNHFQAFIINQLLYIKMNLKIRLYSQWSDADCRKILSNSYLYFIRWNIPVVHIAEFNISKNRFNFLKPFISFSVTSIENESLLTLIYPALCAGLCDFKKSLLTSYLCFIWCHNFCSVYILKTLIFILNLLDSNTLLLFKWVQFLFQLLTIQFSAQIYSLL